MAATAETDYGPARLGLLIEPPDGDGRRGRTQRIDGAAAPSLAAFAEHVRMVWLTPEQDGLFRGAAGERRRFLDRLVLAIDADHGARVAAFERALRDRNRILEEAPFDGPGSTRRSGRRRSSAWRWRRPERKPSGGSPR